MLTLVTDRLLLRPWEEHDLEAAWSWHSDPDVMRHLGGVLDREGSDETVARWRSELNRRGYAMLALCRADSRDPIGAVGLGRPAFRAEFTPCVEIGWRLARQAWGHGYATEAARAVLRDGFDRLTLSEVVAFAAATNTESQRVMARLGMRPDVAGDFTRRISPSSSPSLSVLWRVRPSDLRKELS